ncbi:MAG: hypothetical protein KatS3mg090_0442 [Patescibacteria group bacterium]|nr:MAG: hypothetical protein KatS3mg090_0442 [Patescibacteria group bacterium]
MGITTLEELAKNPNRGPHILTLGEAILDGFLQNPGLNLETLLKFATNVEEEREGGQRIILPTTALGPVSELLNNAEFNLGGGANVIRGLAHFSRVTAILPLDPKCSLTGIWNSLFAKLENIGVQIIRIEQHGRGNPTKIRLVDEQNQVIASLDFRPQGSISSQTMLQVIKNLIKNYQNGMSVIISDYGRGMFPLETLNLLASEYPFNGAPLYIDPRKGSYNFPKGILKPNLEEAQAMVGRTDLPPEELAKALLQVNPNLTAVILTLDGDGALYLDNEGNLKFFPPGIMPEEVVNPSGAGDIFISTMALLEAVGLSRDIAIQTALFLASASVTLPGTSTLSPELLDYALYMALRHRSPLHFLSRYREISSHNGSIPREPLEGTIGTVLENLGNLESFLYPDAKEFIERIKYGPQVFIWTRGEILTPDGRQGYQTFKARASGIDFPIIGGLNKIEILYQWLETHQDKPNQIIVIDDKPENLINAKQILENAGITARLFLIDRTGKYAKKTYEGIHIVKLLTDESLLNLLQETNNTWLIDLDYTLLNHGDFRRALAIESSRFRPPVPINKL